MLLKFHIFKKKGETRQKLKAEPEQKKMIQNYSSESKSIINIAAEMT